MVNGGNADTLSEANLFRSAKKKSSAECGADKENDLSINTKVCNAILSVALSPRITTTKARPDFYDFIYGGYDASGLSLRTLLRALSTAATAMQATSMTAM
eukprot:6178498-Pleurochrysis_carterae.AAC.2